MRRLSDGGGWLRLAVSLLGNRRIYTVLKKSRSSRSKGLTVWMPVLFKYSGYWFKADSISDRFSYQSKVSDTEIKRDKPYRIYLHC